MNNTDYKNNNSQTFAPT